MHIYLFGIITMLFVMNPANLFFGILYGMILVWTTLADGGVLCALLFGSQEVENLVKVGVPVTAIILYTLFFVPAVCQSGAIKWLGLASYSVHFATVWLMNQKRRLLPG